VQRVGEHQASVFVLAAGVGTSSLGV
jgi:hypothetical protein